MKTIAIANQRRQMGQDNPQHRTRVVQALLTPELLRSEYVEKARSARDLAKQFGVNRQTIANYLRHNGLSPRLRGNPRVYGELRDIEGFAAPSSAWHAYWLGFLTADGCVHNTAVRIRLKAADQTLIEDFQSHICPAQPIRDGITNAKYSFSELTLYSRQLVELLAPWGIVPNKTLTISFPPMPAQFLPDYIRGYFDGDGTIYWRHRGAWVEGVCRFISGSPAFLNGLADTLNFLGVHTLPVARHGCGNAYVLPLSSAKGNLRAFASLIYQDDSVCLKRKQELLLLA